MPRIDYSDEGIVEPPPEVKVGTQVLSEKPIIVRKYVDDNVTIEKLNYDRTDIVNSNNGKTKTKQAFKSQNSFRTITSRAEDKGMVVNTDKTQIIVISDSLSYTPRTVILDKNGNKICCSDRVKILGF